MKSHRWVDAHRGKFQAFSGTEGSSDNGFIDSSTPPKKKSSNNTLGSPQGAGQRTGDLFVCQSVSILTYSCSSLVTERKCLYMPLEMKRRWDLSWV